MPDSNEPIFKSKWDRGVFSPLSVSVALHMVAIVGLSGFLGNWGMQKMMAPPEPEIWVEMVVAEAPVQEKEIMQAVPPDPMPLPEKRVVEGVSNRNPAERQNKQEKVESQSVAFPHHLSPTPVQSQVQQPELQLQGVGDVESYTAHIVSKINAHKFYPVYARQRREEGDLVLSFHVSRGGGVDNIRIVQSSFSHTLDSAAIQAVKASAPFHPPPSYLPDRFLHFTLPIRYRLKEN